MAALLLCERCRRTFDGPRYLTHVTDGGCQPRHPAAGPVCFLAGVGVAAVVLVALLELADAAAADPDGFASWLRVLVGTVLAVAGTVLAWRELR